MGGVGCWKRERDEDNAWGGVVSKLEIGGRLEYQAGTSIVRPVRAFAWGFYLVLRSVVGRLDGVGLRCWIEVDGMSGRVSSVHYKVASEIAWKQHHRRGEANIDRTRRLNSFYMAFDLLNHL